MKAKTISKILAGKHAQWCQSIEDEKVRKLVEDNTIITGGCIVSMLLNEEISDFDVYFRTPEAAYGVAQYYVKKLLQKPPPAFKGAGEEIEIKAIMEPAVPEGQEQQRLTGIVRGPLPPRVRVVIKSAGVAGEEEQNDYQYFEGISDPTEQADAAEAYASAALGEDSEVDAYVNATSDADEQAAEKLDTESKKGKKQKGSSKYRVLFVTSNAITLSDQIQIVIRFQGEADVIHENFDFVHCTSYWTSWDKQLTLRKDALECILTKELRYIGSKYPICSIIRTRKFITRGWTINAGQYVKMAWQVSQLDMSSPVVLEDQLVGVDSAYFRQVIELLQEAPDPKRIDGTYLMSVIDKVF